MHMRSKFFSRKIIYGAFVGATMVALTLITQQYLMQQKTTKKNLNLATQTTANAALKISACVQHLKSIVDSLAADLSNQNIDKKKIIELLTEKSSSLHGLGIFFFSTKDRANNALFAPYVINKDNKSSFIDLATLTDYPINNDERFIKPIMQQSLWHEPFLDKVSNSLVLEYATLFYDKNNKVQGIVFGNYTAAYLQRLVASLYPTTLGYGAIIKRNGIFISHPNDENIGSKKTLIDIARTSTNPQLALDMENALAGKLTLVHQDTNWISGQSSWIIFEPIPSTDWYTLGTFVLSELENKTQHSKRETINIVISVIISLFLLVLIGLNYTANSYLFSWGPVAASSLGLLVIIAVIWHSAFTLLPTEPNKIIQKNFDMGSLIEKINNNEPITLDSSSHTKNEKKIACSENIHHSAHKSDYTLIPTGIFINQLSLDLNTVTIGGYAWQRIPQNISKKIKPGIILSQAKELFMSEAYRKNTDAWETIGWNFRATLQQYFNYFNYPIDFKHIRIKLVPNSFDNSTVLIPDFDGYKALNATSLPGINPRVLIPSWNLLQSYFSYQKEPYTTNYGIHSSNSYVTNNEPNRMPIPQLFFNIITSRQMLSSLVLNLMPIIIILILLFMILLMMPTMEFQFVFGSIASLFFSALIAYTTFKNYLPTQSIIFFDYLYFILQGIVLLSALIGILYHRKPSSGLISDKDLMFLQRLFWPLILGIVSVISFIFFY